MAGPLGNRSLASSDQVKLVRRVRLVVKLVRVLIHKVLLDVPIFILCHLSRKAGVYTRTLCGTCAHAGLSSNTCQGTVCVQTNSMYGLCECCGGSDTTSNPSYHIFLTLSPRTVKLVHQIQRFSPPLTLPLPLIVPLPHPLWLMLHVPHTSPFHENY